MEKTATLIDEHEDNTVKVQQSSTDTGMLGEQRGSIMLSSKMSALEWRAPQFI